LWPEGVDACAGAEQNGAAVGIIVVERGDTMKYRAGRGKA
jgi:hypothetical protein